MTDRLPGKPRRYKLTFEDGSGTKYAEIQHADEPITEGTPLNKANLMPDTLAAKICPGVSDPTPADGMDGLRKGAGWWYTAVFPLSGWRADTTKTGYTVSQTVNVTAVDGGPAFTSTTFTDEPMVNLTGNAANDDALLGDLAVITKGYKEPSAGRLKIYLTEQPVGVTSMQIYMRGRANG